jgi:hypothetical protein
MTPVLKPVVVAAFASIVLVTPALSQSSSMQQQSDACNGDALRLCGAYVPDHGKIHSCLIANKASLTPACRAMVTPARQHKRERQG